jgi:hypothetical protein
VTTTTLYGNVSASNVVVTPAAGVTGISVTGNIYASNAVTTTTLYGNVSASNVVVTPAAGVTGISVTGNIYASNAVTTTNLFAVNETLTGSISVSQGSTFYLPTIGTQSSSQNFPGINATGYNVTTSLGTFIISASSEYGTQYSWLAFDSSSSTYWQIGAFVTGTYNSSSPYQYLAGVYTTSTGSTTYGGEWIQLQAPVKISPTQIVLGVGGYDPSFAPGAYVILGSNTGGAGSWTLLATQSSFTTPQTTNIVGAGNYNYIRIVFTNIKAGNSGGLGCILIQTAVITGTYLQAATSTSVYSEGYIGIGVTNATSSLHVIGNVYASNALSTTNVFATSVVPVYPISFRNRIINGDFIIDQRNAGASSTPGTGKTQVIDRWKVEIAGTGRCLVGQNLLGVTSPTGFTSYYGMQVSTTTTVNAGDYFFFGQVIEGINVVDLAWGTASAKPITLSFWAYSSVTGTGGGFVRNAGESAGNYTRSYPFTYTINATNTWEYKTVVIPGDTTGQWLSGQLDGVEVGFIMWNGTSFQGTPGVWAGANYTGPSGGTIGYAGSLNSRLLITGVQFEAGLNASQFERRHLGFELAQCQRYYEPTIARLGGYNTTGNFLRSSVYFNAKKRPKVSPTFTVISQLEKSNLDVFNFDSSNFDQSSARFLSNVVATGDAYGQWKVSVDCEF